MAEALGSILVEQLAAAIFVKKIEKHVRLAVDAKEEVEKLQETLGTIQMVLNDAEQRQFNDKSVKHWLDKFKVVACDMEDVLDEWRTEILRSQIEGCPPDENDGNYKQIKEKVSSYLCFPLSCINKVALRYDMGSKIKEIRKRLDSICAEQNKFEFTKSSKVTAYSEGNDENSDRKTSSIVNVSNIFGRESDKMIILGRLLGESSSSSNHELENEPYGPHNIISIIGMGGLGKTTLAQLLINDDRVKTRFENSLMWVCVSEPFNRTKVVQAIIREATKKSTNTSEWNPLHHELCDSIKGKRFLLVLDDVWTDDESDLSPLKDLLRHGAHSSRIIVTTRKESVAEMMNSFQHPLGVLSPDDCWSLISRKAFVGTNRKDNKTLNKIGFEIAKKCKGLPLTASILGSLLNKKKYESEWLSVLESRIWGLEEVEKKLSKPLLLSYNDLQSPLKRCFAYCAIYPKDHQIMKHELIKMWMAQGFLNSTDPESLGEKYFNCLAERSFFQDFSKDIDDGSIICCKMHDIVHDFALFLSKNEFYMKQNRDKPAHHLTSAENEHEVESTSFDILILEAKNLRSLQVSTNRVYYSLINDPLYSSDLFYRLRCLRVLKLSNLDIKQLPSEIKELIHLRYLDLSSNASLNELPDSFCSLYNLQTLKLTGCRGLRKLPKGMGRMINLKHLDVKYTNDKLSLPEGIGKLTSLQTLNRFIVDGASGGCQIRVLKDLNLLQGEIAIMGLGRLKTANEASLAELNKKQGLGHLALIFNSEYTGMTSDDSDVRVDIDAAVLEKTERVFEVLQPHPNLIELSILEYGGSTFPNWIASLTRLTRLTLINCENCTELPSVGLLPSLKLLDLTNIKNLKRIGVEIYGNATAGGTSVRKVAFPKLKKLHIETDNLEVWDMGDGENTGHPIMPCVTKIVVMSSKLKVLPAALWKLPSLETLEIRSSREVTHISPIFRGCGGGGGGGGGVGGGSFATAFPTLKSLTMSGMRKLGEFDLAVDVEGGCNRGDQIIIMPRLAKMGIHFCANLKTLRGLSRLHSLQVLDLSMLSNMEEFKTERGENSIIMPSLLSLNIVSCPKLMSLMQLHLPKLNQLVIEECSSLFQLPTSALNLTSLQISRSSNSSPPQGIAVFQKLQHLFFKKCSFLMCIPEDVRQLTALQTLKIEDCALPHIDPNCTDEVAEKAWSIMSHIPEIKINNNYIVRTADQPTRTGRSSTFLNHAQ